MLDEQVGVDFLEMDMRVISSIVKALGLIANLAVVCHKQLEAGNIISKMCTWAELGGS